MRKHRAKLFLALLILLFFVVAYNKLVKEKLTIKQMTNHSDSLVNSVNPSQFKRAFNYLDSCDEANEGELVDDTSFRVRKDRLSKIVKIMNNED